MSLYTVLLVVTWVEIHEVLYRYMQGICVIGEWKRYRNIRFIDTSGYRYMRGLFG